MMTNEVGRIISFLRARAKVWRDAMTPVPRDNILVADTLDGAANTIEAWSDGHIASVDDQDPNVRTAYNQNLTADQAGLIDYMALLSEEHFSAGWLSNLEFMLWRWLNGAEDSRLRENERAELLRLSGLADGWAVGPDEQDGESADPNRFGRFIPMNEWLAREEFKAR